MFQPALRGVQSDISSPENRPATAFAFQSIFNAEALKKTLKRLDNCMLIPFQEPCFWVANVRLDARWEENPPALARNTRTQLYLKQRSLALKASVGVEPTGSP